MPEPAELVVLSERGISSPSPIPRQKPQFLPILLTPPPLQPLPESHLQINHPQNHSFGGFFGGAKLLEDGAGFFFGGCGSAALAAKLNATEEKKTQPKTLNKKNTHEKKNSN